MKFPLVFRSTYQRLVNAYDKLMHTKLALEGSNNALRLMVRDHEGEIKRLKNELKKHG